MEIVHTKLEEIIDRMSATQIDRMALFLKSPYFNQGVRAPKIVKLFQLLTADRNAWKSKADASSIIFPDKEFKANAKNPIDSISSELFQLAKQFIHVDQTSNNINSPESLLSLIRFYRAQNMEHRFRQTTDSLHTFLQNRTVQDSDYFFNLLQLEQEIAQFNSTYNTYIDDANMARVNQALDTYFAVQKLGLTAGLKYQGAIGGETGEAEKLLGELLLRNLSDIHYLDIHYIRIFQKIHELLAKEVVEQDIEALGALLETHKEVISPLDLRNFHAYYRSFYSKVHFNPTQNPKSYQLLFDLYKQQLRDGHIYVEGKILPATLKLLSNIGLKVGDTNWVKEFLENHPPEKILGTKFTEEVHSLCKGDLLFYEGKYDLAQDYLEYKPFENPQFSLLADILLIKSYYETQNPLLASKMEAFRQKARRTKVKSGIRAACREFVKLLEKIEKNRVYKASPGRLQKIREGIQSQKDLYEREWLLSKLEEL